jgi:hypothetical protein
MEFTDFDTVLSIFTCMLLDSGAMVMRCVPLFVQFVADTFLGAPALSPFANSDVFRGFCRF